MPRNSNRKDQDGRTHFWTHFLDWREFLTACQAPAEWGNVEDLTHTLQLAKYGWPEGRKLFKTITEKLNPMESPLRNMKHATTNDVAGYQPDIQAFLSGAPDHMINYGDQTIEAAPIVQLQINIDAPGAVPGSYMANHAVAVASLVDALETQGYQCELRLANATFSNKGPNGSTLTMYTCEFKKAGEPLDPDLTVFALGHPDVLRQLLFSIYRSSKEVGRRFGNGYGAPTMSIPEDYTDPGVINIPPADRECRTIESALRRIVRILKEGNSTVDWNFLDLLIALLDNLADNAMKMPTSTAIH
jgi:hypothetical protein